MIVSRAGHSPDCVLAESLLPATRMRLFALGTWLVRRFVRCMVRSVRSMLLSDTRGRGPRAPCAVIWTGRVCGERYSLIWLVERASALGASAAGACLVASYAATSSSASLLRSGS